MGSPLHKSTSGHGTAVLEKPEMADLSPEMKLVRDALFRHVGKPLPRKEDGRLITGKGRFSDDLACPGRRSLRWFARHIRMRGSSASTQRKRWPVPAFWPS